MTAEQMFKELGYEKEEDKNAIYYFKSTELSEKLIGFDKESKQIIVNDIYRFMILSQELQKAIFKQSSELGWLD